MMKTYLYILKSEAKETYYTGVSANPEKRCFFHNHGSKGYTQRYRPWELAFTKGFATKQKALAAERKVKDWKSKKMTKLLIEEKIDIEVYL